MDGFTINDVVRLVLWVKKKERYSRFLGTGATESTAMGPLSDFGHRGS